MFIQSDALYIVQLQIIHLLNHQCNVLLTYSPSTIAETLVSIACKRQSLCRSANTWQS